MKTLATATLILMAAASVVASGEDDPTSLSYISYLERYATIQPVNNDENIEAAINMPLVVGDRVDTAREARMEVVLADGAIVWLDQYTSISLDAVAYSRDVGGERTVLYLIDGKIILRVPEHVLSTEPLRIDSSSATVYLTQPGTYRVEVLRSGGLRVEVWEGRAEAATTAGGVLIEPETAAEVRNGDVTGVEPYLTWGDDFAQWVDQRRQSYESESAGFVDERYARNAAVLDSYGTWVYVDATQSWAWQPSVGPDWRPYTAGRWYWTPTGWSWVSYEPWGWLPYHYGSWYFSAGFGWVWGWGSVWSPAWVSWCWWPGYVGWCPWGYYNTWCWNRYPGWGGGYYPYPPGAGQPRPPRGDVVPPRDGAQPGDAGRRQTPDPRVRAGAAAAGEGRRVTPAGGDSLRASSAGRVGADFTGRVRVAEIDRTGWNVVAADDFASPHLSRSVQPGSRVMPDQGDATGVVVTGPLTTRSPARASAADEISRTFADVGDRTDRDITRIMARDPSLRSEDLTRLVQPSSLAELGRSSAQSVIASRTTPTSPATSNAGAGAGPELGVAGRSPFVSPTGTRSSAGRVDTANIYRPGRTTSSGGSPTPSRTLIDPTTRSVGRPGVPPASSAGRLAPSGRSLPSTRSSSSLPSVRGSSSVPSARSSSSPLVRQPVTPRVGVGRSTPYTGSTRPVIVPRTSPTRPSRNLGSGSPYTGAPSIRGVPSSGRSSSSVRAPSRSSSSSAPRATGTRSSGSSSPSPKASAPSRSSASSGGTRRH